MARYPGLPAHCHWPRRRVQGRSSLRKGRVLDALISDCDGVIADSEPIHLVCFQQVLAEQSVPLTEEAYYAHYLGFDDHDCLAAAGRDNGREFSEDDLAAMTAAKTKLVQRHMHEGLTTMPGVAALFQAVDAAGVPMAVCSGGLRTEVALSVKTAGILDLVETLVCAEDVRLGKPDPEGYALALQRLSDATGRPLAAAKTVVLEDSPAGIEAAKAVGMKVLAVATSYAPDALTGADRTVATLADVGVADLEALL